MIHLAELNHNNICIGTKTVSEFIEDGKHVEIDSADFELYSWRKYENGQWSSEKFEPKSTAPLDEFEQLKADNEMLKAMVADIGLMVGGGL